MDLKLLKVNTRYATAKRRSNFIAIKSLLKDSQLSARQKISKSLLIICSLQTKAFPDTDQILTRRTVRIGR